jgi:hypothetical protein
MISSATPRTRYNSSAVQSPFSSFWMGGYECTDKLNAFGNRVDFLSVTGHLEVLDADYKLLHPFNIKTVREGIRWSQVEKSPYQYDWSTVALMIRHGKKNNIQQIWDLCHFGFPDDLTPLHPLFARRFASLCRAFVQFYRSQDPHSRLIITPINEVSFISWLGGEVRGTTPYCIGQGWEVKYALMRAYIEGVAALKEADPSILILTTEPSVQMVPSLNADSEEIEEAMLAHEEQFQAVDILTGRMCPDLGGSPDYLDILGMNYYYNNQWVVSTKQFLPWANLDPDPRWQSFRMRILESYARYEKPVVVSETSHSREDRPHWIRFITEECAAVIRQGIPLWGICLYPIIDRPDWDHFSPWHASGLWDAVLTLEGPPQRVLYQPYAKALLECQQMIREASKLNGQRSMVNGLGRETGKVNGVVREPQT